MPTESNAVPTTRNPAAEILYRELDLMIRGQGTPGAKANAQQEIAPILEMINQLEAQDANEVATSAETFMDLLQQFGSFGCLGLLVTNAMMALRQVGDPQHSWIIDELPPAWHDGYRTACNLSVPNPFSKDSEDFQQFAHGFCFYFAKGGHGRPEPTEDRVVKEDDQPAYKKGFTAGHAYASNHDVVPPFNPYNKKFDGTGHRLWEEGFAAARAGYPNKPVPEWFAKAHNEARLEDLRQGVPAVKEDPNDKYAGQIVLAVPRSALAGLFPSGITNGLLTSSEHGDWNGAVLLEILKDADFIPRGPAETDPRFKQIIPYVMVVCGNHILTYSRNKNGGEDRLHGQRSLGIGGHTNPLAGEDRKGTFWGNFWKELKEETGLESGDAWEVRVAGFLNNDSDPVGQVHVGVAIVVRVTRNNVKLDGEDGLSDLQWMSLEQLSEVEHYDCLETWSKMFLDGLFLNPRLGSKALPFLGLVHEGFQAAVNHVKDPKAPGDNPYPHDTPDGKYWQRGVSIYFNSRAAVDAGVLNKVGPSQGPGGVAGKTANEVPPAARERGHAAGLNYPFGVPVNRPNPFHIKEESEAWVIWDEGFQAGIAERNRNVGRDTVIKTHPEFIAGYNQGLTGLPKADNPHGLESLPDPVTGEQLKASKDKYDLWDAGWEAGDKDRALHRAKDDGPNYVSPSEASERPEPPPFGDDYQPL